MPQAIPAPLVVRRLAVAVLTLALSAPAVRAADWNVNASGTGDFPTIQAAFDGAAPGDRIVLAPGVYRDSHTRTVPDIGGQTTTTEAVAFAAPGVTLTSSAGAAVTFIDGELVRKCLVGVDLGTVEVSGVTLVDGRANGSGGLLAKAAGGFVVERSDITVRDCVFLRNVAPRINTDGGGGLYLIDCPTADIRFNKFIDNFGGDLGGAMELYLVGSAVVRNNTFVRNEAGDRAGAIMINTSTCDLSHNIFADNLAATGGGAVGCLNGGSVTGSCNLFWNNTAPGTPHIYQCPAIVLGSDENIEADPQFCAPGSDNFLIRSSSPASPTAPGVCGLRGACPVGCGPVSVADQSWGTVKARYR